ncbi:MAG: hypothetical protein ABH823_02545 [bacterium]
MKKYLLLSLILLSGLLLGMLLQGSSCEQVTDTNTTTTSADTTTTTTSTTTTSTTTTSTTTTTAGVQVSGTGLELDYQGNPIEYGESFTFATQGVTSESIFDFDGDIINVGSLFWANTSEVGAGIIDMGATTLTAVTSAPADMYTGSWNEAAVGRVACIKTTAGKFAKIRVTSHEAGNNTSFTIDWVYRTDGGRTFEAD